MFVGLSRTRSLLLSYKRPSVECVSDYAAVCVWIYERVFVGGVESACMRLRTVWPLSVKVESSAEAYGRPQPSPRHLTRELHWQEKPSET